MDFLPWLWDAVTARYERAMEAGGICNTAVYFYYDNISQSYRAIFTPNTNEFISSF